MTFDIRIGDKTEIEERNSVSLFTLEFITQPPEYM